MLNSSKWREAEKGASQGQFTAPGYLGRLRGTQGSGVLQETLLRPGESLPGTLRPKIEQLRLLLPRACCDISLALWEAHPNPALSILESPFLRTPPPWPWATACPYPPPPYPNPFSGLLSSACAPPWTSHVLSLRAGTTSRAKTLGTCLSFLPPQRPPPLLAHPIASSPWLP
jgi:hypothetical protein